MPDEIYNSSKSGKLTLYFDNHFYVVFIITILEQSLLKQPLWFKQEKRDEEAISLKVKV